MKHAVYRTFKRILVFLIIVTGMFLANYCSATAISNSTGQNIIITLKSLDAWFNAMPNSKSGFLLNCNLLLLSNLKIEMSKVNIKKISLKKGEIVLIENLKSEYLVKDLSRPSESGTTLEVFVKVNETGVNFEKLAGKSDFYFVISCGETDINFEAKNIEINKVY